MKKYFFYISIVFITVLLLLAFFPNVVTQYAPSDQNAEAILLSPGTGYFLGTDSLGRDMMARLLQATRVSLLVSVASTFIALVIGVAWGLLAGLGSDRRDQFMMRIVDVLYSVPDLLFYILLGIIMGRSITGIIIALCSLSWLSIARISRAEAKKYRNQEFVVAARAIGMSPFRLATRHVMPQMLEPLLVSIIFKIPFVIILESTLSFIGLGLKPPFASFGTLAKEGFDAYLFYPHLIVYPFVFIFLTVFSFYSIGNFVKMKTVQN